MFSSAWPPLGTAAALPSMDGHCNGQCFHRPPHWFASVKGTGRKMKPEVSSLSKKKLRFEGNGFAQVKTGKGVRLLKQIQGNECPDSKKKKKKIEEISSYQADLKFGSLHFFFKKAESIVEQFRSLNFQLTYFQSCHRESSIFCVCGHMGMCPCAHTLRWKS